MKPILIFFMISSFLKAAPVVSELAWREACGGATIEIISDEAKTVSVRARAVHFAVIVEWTIHYVKGTPVTAEFRESERGRILEGDDAGGLSGMNRLKRLETFHSQGGRFQIADEVLSMELASIISKLPK